MSLSISPRERLDRILNSVRLHLYGITSTQVLNLFDPFFLSNWMFYYPCFCNLGIIADIEFGRLQARDMLQHLWTGPISNASVDVVQGSRSVEVRAVGVTKVTGFYFLLFHLFASRSQLTVICSSTYSTISFPIQGAAIDRILGEIVHSKSISTPIDYVLCVGHFLGKVYFSTFLNFKHLKPFLCYVFLI